MTAQASNIHSFSLSLSLSLYDDSSSTTFNLELHLTELCHVIGHEDPPLGHEETDIAVVKLKPTL